MSQLSILIPTMNDECLTLVKALQSQCSEFNENNKADGEFLEYEIIVADDGSTDNSVIDRNRGIDSIPHCRYIIRDKNSGRAAIRNFLAGEAKFAELLFIDSDMTVIRNDFVSKYLENSNGKDVIYGGYDVPEQKNLNNNLRYRYERACRKNHTAEKRQLSPYLDFHTSNFMIPRSIMIAHPFNESFRHYGYEDVAFGEELKKSGIRIKHIDNPVGFCRFESNEAFVSKTEEGLRTLAEFRSMLKDYSRLLQVVDKLRKCHLEGIIRSLTRPFLSPMRGALTGKNIPLEVLNIYKISYLLGLLSNKNF